MIPRSLTFALLLLCFFGLTPAVAESSVSLLGEWKVTAERPNNEGTRESSVTISKQGDKLVAVATLAEGQQLTSNRLTTEGKEVQMDFGFEYDGQALTIRIKAEEIARGQLKGKWQVIGSDDNELMSAAWEASRTSEPEPEADIAGTWNAVSVRGNGEQRESVVVFSKTEEGYKGTFQSENRDLTFDAVKVEGSHVEALLTFARNDREMEVTIRAKQTSPDALVGKWIVFDDNGQERASGEWKASREASFDLAGHWDVVASTDNGDLKLESIFEKEGEGYRGTSKSDGGEADYTAVGVEGGQVTLEIPFGDGTVRIVAAAENSDSLKGNWHFFDASGEEVASNVWGASRRASAEAATQPSVTGDWAIQIIIGESTLSDYGLRITRDGEALTGMFSSPQQGEATCKSVSFAEGKLAFSVTRESGGKTIEFVYEGTLEGEALTGTVNGAGLDSQLSGTWSAKRP